MVYHFSDIRSLKTFERFSHIKSACRKLTFFENVWAPESINSFARTTSGQYCEFSATMKTCSELIETYIVLKAYDLKFQGKIHPGVPEASLPR